MAQVRSDRLGYVERTSAGTTTMFTVPGGETYLVKRLVTAGPTAAIDGLWQIFDPSSNAINGRIVRGATSPWADDWETWWALDAGCVLKFTTSAAGTVRGMAFGAKLSGVAP